MNEVRTGAQATPPPGDYPTSITMMESNRSDSFWATHTPTFSIVSACYSVRQYLPDFLASLDSQSVDKQDCQVIFVVDGCPEDSGEVVRAWMARTEYPVILIHKINGGVASARNAGISMATGTWITSPDPDDTLDPEYLTQLFYAIDEHPGETMFAANLNTIDETGKSMTHPLDFRFSTHGDRVVKLEEENRAGWIHLSGGTTVWSRQLIQAAKLSFDERLRTGSDADFNLRYLLVNGARYVLVPTAYYHYLKRPDESSIIGRAKHDYRRYEATVTISHANLLRLANGHCPSWLGNAILYAISHLFRGNLRPDNPVYDLTPAQRKTIATSIRQNLAKIDSQTIQNFNLTYVPYEIRTAWLAVTGRLNRSPVIQKEYDTKFSRYKLTFYSSTIDLQYTVRTPRAKQPTWTRSTRAVEFLGEIWSYEHIVRISAPRRKEETARSRPHPRLVSKTPGWAFEFQGEALSERRAMKRCGLLPQAASRPKVKHGSDQAASNAHPPEAPKPEPQSRPVWVIDCAHTVSLWQITLYDQIVDAYPRVDVWLVVDQTHPLYGKREIRERQSVERGTDKHISVMEDCSLVLTSNIDWMTDLQSRGSFKKGARKFVYLPPATSPFPNYRRFNRCRFDAALVASRFELEQLTGTASPYDIDERNVYLTGSPYRAPRHDIERANAPSRGGTLVIAPGALGVLRQPDTETEPPALTEYLAQWRQFLRSAKLQGLRARNEVDVHLIIPGAYADVVDALDMHGQIEWSIQGSERARSALADCAVLLTDYSDLTFDAAASRAPSVYLQFPGVVEQAAPALELPGSFSFERDGFGPVTNSASAAFEALDRTLNLNGEERHALVGTDVEHSDGRSTDRILVALADIAGLEDHRNSPCVGATPSISVVINCNDDAELLRQTLATIDQTSLGVDFEVLLILRQGKYRTSTYSAQTARSFSNHNPLTTRLLILQDDEFLTESDIAEHSSGDWICIVEPGARFLPGGIHSLSRLIAVRPDLRIIAAYPQIRDKNPFLVRYDIARQGVSVPAQRVLSLDVIPDAFTAGGICTLIRREAFSEDARALNFYPAGLWVPSVRAMRRGNFRMGLLADFVAAADGTKSRLTLVARSAAERRRLTEHAIATLENLRTHPEEDRAAAVSVSIWLALEALRHFADEDWDGSDDAWAKRSSLANILEGLPQLALARSRWALRLASRYALCSFAGTRADPFVAGTVGNTGRFLYAGEPVAELADTSVELMNVRVRSDNVEVEATFMRYSSDVDLALIGTKGEILTAVESVEDVAGQRDRYGKYVAMRASYRRFNVPIGDSPTTWKFAILDLVTLRASAVSSVQQGARSPFVVGTTWLTRFNSRGAVRFLGKRALRIVNRPPSRWRYLLGSYRRLLRTGAAAPARLASTRRKDVLLITDRPRFGDDNGEALFRYIQQHRPDLRSRSWLVLDRSAASYSELKRTRRLVRPGSFRHQKLYLNAQILLSSHVGEVYNNPFFGKPRSQYADLADATFIWLQHGITMNSVDSVFSRFRRGHDGVVLGARHELDYGAQPKFGLNDGRLLATGFPRFDLLENHASRDRRTILYMPTWRSWLVGDRQSTGVSAALEGFRDDDYFRHQSELLTDPELLSLLDESDAIIEMVLHPAMSGYVGYYRELASRWVIIHEPGSVYYRDMFASGSALITDYSSVFFDFSYLGKPVIFDHHDSVRFHSSHYKGGVFDYASQAPGDIVHSIEELTSSVRSLVGNSFRLSERNRSRLNKLFIYRDQGNSARVLERALEVDAARRR